MLNHTQQGYHKTASTTLSPFSGLLDSPQIIANRAYLGSLGRQAEQPTSFVELEAQQQKLWNEMSQDNIRNLYALMLARIAMRIRARGVPTEH
ncbi:hypothetical protein TNCV_5084601 [Trichonephila clavipes]|uniref:Uncharacterized protein n=1 Tax=Trichonephila clavipes TaxID=2585209 RepID=A0A8X6S9G6_TRICX|nr:hypothetical protein TNCV_5084601 [Trichonephila clavipes]